MKDRMRVFACILSAAVIVACRAPAGKQYELRGQILAVEQARDEVLIRHEDVKGFMPAMTMPFKVKDPALLSGKEPGDLVTATLVVSDVDAHLATLTRTGHAPLEAPPVVQDVPRILVEGEQVPDALLVDQTGAPRPFSSLRGHRVALTFTYTRCPLPEFCPLMDRHFRTVQQTILSTPALADVRLVTMTLDPQFDTTAVLARHAESVRANPAVWSFVTAEPKEAARFAQQFGIHTERDGDESATLIHNLRTAVIDPGGRVVKLHSGNDWTPADLVADLKAAPAPAH